MKQCLCVVCVLKITGFELEGREELRGLRHRSYNSATMVTGGGGGNGYWVGGE
jgi:hypothetical protein